MRVHDGSAAMVGVMLILGTACLATSDQAFQRKVSPAAEIVELMERLDRARSQNPASEAAIYADDFFQVGSDGRIRSKHEWLRFVAGLSREIEFTTEDSKMFAYGEAILFVRTVHVKGILNNGRTVDKRERITHVWVRQDGRWQLAAKHHTDIR